MEDDNIKKFASLMMILWIVCVWVVVLNTPANAYFYSNGDSAKVGKNVVTDDDKQCFCEVRLGINFG